MKQMEDRQHILTCKDPIAKAYRDKLIIGLRTDLYKIQTSPFIVNHLIRIIREYHYGSDVTKLKPDDVLDEKASYAALINKVIDFGADNLLSAVITHHVSVIQEKHIDDNGLSNSINIIGWTRGIIRLLLEYTNGIWLYRSSILHGKEELSREHLVRTQAVELLHRLKCDPYRLPYTFRDLPTRTRSYLMKSPLQSVLNWIDRVSVALDRQAQNSKLAVSDIRYWLKGIGPYSTNRMKGKYVVPGCTVDYDSDTTLQYEELYPDEDPNQMTWVCDKKLL